MTKITSELRQIASEKTRVSMLRFYKTGNGDYAEADRFLGVSMPDIRKIAQRHADADWQTVTRLMHSAWHEERMCALVILGNRMKRLKRQKSPILSGFLSEKEAKTAREIADFYLANTSFINNWDLVDNSAPQILGTFLLNQPRDVLFRLAESTDLWENRIAIVATLAFVRAGDLDDTFAIAARLLHHPHDLMHKANGWLLREAGKHDRNRLIAFIEAHPDMPRTTLRYAIERFPKAERAFWLTKTKQSIS